MCGSNPSAPPYSNYVIQIIKLSVFWQLNYCTFLSNFVGCYFTLSVFWHITNFIFWKFVLLFLVSHVTLQLCNYYEKMCLEKLLIKAKMAELIFLYCLKILNKISILYFKNTYIYYKQNKGVVCMALNAVNFPDNNLVTTGVNNQNTVKKGNVETINTYPKYDEFTSISQNNSEEKVSFKEGVKLVGKGYVNKVKNMVTSIVEHPIKSILAVGATSLLIAGAPIIGVASATAASILALGFAAYAVGKTAVDVVETVKDNKAGRYNEVREDLQQIGGDGVDLALSLPFAPKAFKQVSRFVHYGNGTVGLNTELLSNLKNCHSFSDVKLEIAKADTLINYEMIGNEMGLVVKPEVQFSKDGFCTPSYDNVSGKVDIPEKLLTPEGKSTLRRLGKNIEVEIRHELEHFNQASDMVRTYGVDGLKQQMIDSYKYIYQENGGTFDTTDCCYEINKKATLGKFGKYKEQVENMLFGDGSKFNEKIYQDVINKQGMYQPGSEQAIKAEQYMAGTMERATRAKEIGELMQNGDRESMLKAYFENILESEAKTAENLYKTSVVKGRPTVVNDVVMADSVAEEYFTDDDISFINKK